MAARDTAAPAGAGRTFSSGNARYGSARFEPRCVECGYGVVVRIAPGRCPMCHGSVWEHGRAGRPVAS